MPVSASLPVDQGYSRKWSPESRGRRRRARQEIEGPDSGSVSTAACTSPAGQRRLELRGHAEAARPADAERWRETSVSTSPRTRQRRAVGRTGSLHRREL